MRWLFTSLVVASALVIGCERGGKDTPTSEYSFLGGAPGTQTPMEEPSTEDVSDDASGGTTPASMGASGGSESEVEDDLEELGGAPNVEDEGDDTTDSLDGDPKMGDPPAAVGVPLSQEPFLLAPTCGSPAQCGSGKACRLGICAPETCGNGSLEGGEECDDGNSQHSDGCELDCQRTRVLDIQSAYSTCVLLSSGRVKCFGADERGILGRGTNEEHVLVPAGIPSLDFGTSRRVTRVEIGMRTVCVLFEDKKARCWGANDYGQLGIGSRDDYGDEPHETLALLPDLPFSNVLQISSGRQHTCVVSLQSTTMEKEVTCWGNSESGQRGDGYIGILDDAALAEAVALPPVEPVAVHTSASTTCLLFEPGEVACWGNNSSNGLSGNGNSYAPNLDTDILRLLGSEVDSLSGRAAGPNCAFEAPNTLHTWGSNSGGHLGTPYLLDQNIRTPIRVRLGDREFVDFQMGSEASYGLTAEGEVYGFGRPESVAYAGLYDPLLHPGENWDQLPHGGKVDVGDFDSEPGIDRVRRLFVGRSSACAEVLDGSIRCWGANGDGRLGYGFDSEGGPDDLSTWSRIGDDETPAEAFARLAMPSIALW